MRCEVSSLLVNGFLDWNAVDNIFLRSVLNTDITESQSDFLVHNHALRVCAAIHNIDLGDHTDCADTFGVKLTRHLKAVRGGHICVCGDDAKNNRAGIANISVCHCACNFFDVVRLSSDGDTGDSGKINEGKIGAGVGVNLEHDWLVNDVFVISANFIRKPNDVVLHLLEVCKFSSRNFIGKNRIGGDIPINVVET